MKHTIIILSFLAISYNSYTQSITDIKEYINEIIKSNDPISSYDNFSFFKDDILKMHAQKLIGESLSDDVFEHLFIYGLDAYIGENKTGNAWLSEAQSIDIRGMKKIATQRVKDKNRYYYKVIIYVKPNYLGKKYQKTSSIEEVINVDKISILLADNADAVLRVKKAFFKLGELLGLEVIDGDFF